MKLSSRNNRIRRKQRRKKNQFYTFITAIILIIGLSTGILVTTKKEKLFTEANPELLRSQTYKTVNTEEDKIITSLEDESEIGVFFDAFFKKDIDGDGILDLIRGTCNKIGNSADLYMELGVQDGWYIKDSRIIINSENFYFNTSIIQDDEISTNYISTNTQLIEFNQINGEITKALNGSIRSGDYSSASTKASAIGDDTSKYSKENSITFIGVAVDSEGVEKKFQKNVQFTVDWYGEINCEIDSTIQSYENLESLRKDDGLYLTFPITTKETLNEVIMEGSFISGTIPSLNGYKPLSVEISGTNVSYEYNDETGEFRAQRIAEKDENGIITSNAYYEQDGETRYNRYEFLVVYPVEAYDELGNTVSSIELAVPVSAGNRGFNNPHIESGFNDRIDSNEAKKIVVINWRKNVEITDSKFNISIGTYRKEFDKYLISKSKPIKIYNKNSLSEKDDIYEVKWIAIKTNKKAAGIIMEEGTGKSDTFFSSGTSISMEEITANKGIYFTGATSALGLDGWIKVYNRDTNELIKEFTSKDWNGTYNYTTPIKHIRVETSEINGSSDFTVNNIKELDDEYITENFTREEFDNLSEIHTYLSGGIKTYATGETTEIADKSNVFEKASYEAPVSFASIAVDQNKISTQTVATNKKIVINTETLGYNEQMWKNGIFLVKLPSEIIDVKINDVTISDVNAKILTYNTYVENRNYYIKISTECAYESAYIIRIDCDLTPDPIIKQGEKIVELYAINEESCGYYQIYSKEDIYDLDGDLDKEEKVNYTTAPLSLRPTNQTVNTTQSVSEYNGDNRTVSPGIAIIDSSQTTAKISISAINNYNNSLYGLTIVGSVPGRDSNLNSDYEARMESGGIRLKPLMQELQNSEESENPQETQEEKEYRELENKTRIYYSTNENPNYSSSYSWNWILAENVTDWSKIKSYKIVINNSYEFLSQKIIEFEYNISIPSGVDYNRVSYSKHKIYYNSSSQESEKLGLMIGKRYNLEIEKYQEDTEKKLEGITFSIKEDGKDTGRVRVTDKNGKITFSDLFVNRYYILKEQRTTDDYVLNSQEIRFYIDTINEGGIERLRIHYVDENKVPIEPLNFIRNKNQEIQNDIVKIQIDNKTKAKLTITTVDAKDNSKLNNTQYRLFDNEDIKKLEEKKVNIDDNNINENEISNIGKIYMADKNGQINISGIYLDKEYVLKEIKSTGYYLTQSVKFKIRKDNGEFVLDYTDNGSTLSKEIIKNDDEIPIINLKFKNDKIPTYSLQLTKYAKNEKITDESGVEKDKVLKGAQYKLNGEGISDQGRLYTTDANGIITIDGLYEYVDEKYITGIYTLTEIFAPEGYLVNSTPIKFQAYRKEGILIIEILDGADQVRNYDNRYNDIVNPESDSPVANIEVEDEQVFYLHKKDADTGEPVAGAKFKITDLNGKIISDKNGKVLDNLVTDENGNIMLNLAGGLYYKAKEIEAPEGYILPEEEIPFKLQDSQGIVEDWAQSVRGNGWNYINSVDATEDGGTIAVGSFSSYSPKIVANAKDEIYLDADRKITKTSRGKNDGIIVLYDKNGEFVWSKTFGGSEDDCLNKVIQTSDGGIVAVGYTSSKYVFLDEEEITDLTRTSGQEKKDGILLKLDSKGNFVWGIRIGGTLEDEIRSVIETSENNIVIVGYKDSSKGFIDSYSLNGILQWDSILNSDGIDVRDVAEICDESCIWNPWGKLLVVANDNFAEYYKITGEYINKASLGTKPICFDTTANGEVIVGSELNTWVNRWGVQIYRLNGWMSVSEVYLFYGNFDNYIADVKATSDGGIILGGWLYSSQFHQKIGLDGKYALTEGNVNDSNAYTIKLDKDNNVEFASSISGSKYDGVLSVTESKAGKVVSGGYFSSPVLTITNFNNGVNAEDTITIDRIGNSEGFVIGQWHTNIKAPEVQMLEVENQLKRFEIITSVRNHLENGVEVAGGTITGSETVIYGNDSSPDKIIITPNSGYVIKTVEINGKKVKDLSLDDNVNEEKIEHGYTINDDGTIILENFKNVKENIEVVVEFSNTISSVIANHYMWTKDSGTTTEKVAESKIYTGSVGTKYAISPENIADYEIITNFDYYSKLPESDLKELYKTYNVNNIDDLLVELKLDKEDYYIPQNAKGNYKENETIEVNYYYKERNYTLTVHHYLENTNTPVPLKGSENGEGVPDEVSKEDKNGVAYTKGIEYETTKASEDKINYKIYELAFEPKNAKGIIKENTEVTYYYRVKTNSLKIVKVAKENDTVKLADTNFSLYKLVCTEHEKGYHDTKIIDYKKEDDTCWEKVGEYVTDNNGEIVLNNLSPIEEYRLVETKASEGRINPTGQWKLEFVLDEQDKTDENVFEMGTDIAIRITSIGEVLGAELCDLGEAGKCIIIKNENEKEIVLPLTGGIGNTLYYVIGTMITIGVLVLLIRNKKK